MRPDWPDWTACVELLAAVGPPGGASAVNRVDAAIARTTISTAAVVKPAAEQRAGFSKRAFILGRCGLA